MTYEMLDLDSYNLVGTYPNEDVALLAILHTIKQSGEEAAGNLSLSVLDPTGRTDGKLIAQGHDLVMKARTRFSVAQSVHA